MVLPPSFSRKMGQIETVEAEKIGWIYLPRGTFYPTLPYWRNNQISTAHAHNRLRDLS